MTTKSIKIQGKVWTVECNNSGEISKEIQGLPVEVLRDMPRSKHGSKGAPYIMDEEGKEFRLGYKYMTKEERAEHDAYVAEHKGKGKPGAGKIFTQDQAKTILESLPKSAPKEFREFLEGIANPKPKGLSKEEKLVQQLIKLGLSEEVAKKQAASAMAAIA